MSTHSVSLPTFSVSRFCNTRIKENEKYGSHLKEYTDGLFPQNDGNRLRYNTNRKNYFQSLSLIQ